MILLFIFGSGKLIKRFFFKRDFFVCSFKLLVSRKNGCGDRLCRCIVFWICVGDSCFSLRCVCVCLCGVRGWGFCVFWLFGYYCGIIVVV